MAFSLNLVFYSSLGTNWFISNISGSFILKFNFVPLESNLLIQNCRILGNFKISSEFWWPQYILHLKHFCVAVVTSSNFFLIDFNSKFSLGKSILLSVLIFVVLSLQLLHCEVILVSIYTRASALIFLIRCSITKVPFLTLAGIRPEKTCI
jgi:hypothetical protein